MTVSEVPQQDITEGEFIEAFLGVLQGAFDIALGACSWPLYEAAVERDDLTLFKLIEDMSDSLNQTMARKVLAHQAAQRLSSSDEEQLFEQARLAADASHEVAMVCEDLDTVKRYCEINDVQSTSFGTEELMRRARENSSQS
jgi:hypothetical protein